MALTDASRALRERAQSLFETLLVEVSEFSGHIAIEWTWRGQAYQVSVHRWAGEGQGLMQARQMATAVIGYLRHARTPAALPPEPPH